MRARCPLDESCAFEVDPGVEVLEQSGSAAQQDWFDVEEEFVDEPARRAWFTVSAPPMRYTFFSPAVSFAMAIAVSTSDTNVKVVARRRESVPVGASVRRWAP